MPAYRILFCVTGLYRWIRSDIDEEKNKDVRKASDMIFLAAAFQRRLYFDEEVDL